MTRVRSLLAVAAMMIAAGPVEYEPSLNLWANGAVRDAPARPRKSNASHKQNARRAKKRRK